MQAPYIDWRSQGSFPGGEQRGALEVGHYEQPGDYKKQNHPITPPETTLKPEMWMDNRCGLQWATDTAFGPAGYLTPPGTPSVDDINDYLASHLSCFEPIHTSDATHGTSLIVTGRKISPIRRRTACNRPVNRLFDELSHKERRKLTHIVSERTRRIKLLELFRDIQALVPGLEGHTLSRKTVLAQTVDYIESLVAGNEVLKAQLDQLRGL